MLRFWGALGYLGHLFYVLHSQISPILMCFCFSCAVFLTVLCHPIKLIINESWYEDEILLTAWVPTKKKYFGLTYNLSCYQLISSDRSHSEIGPLGEQLLEEKQRMQPTNGCLHVYFTSQEWHELVAVVTPQCWLEVHSSFTHTPEAFQFCQGSLVGCMVNWFLKLQW